MANGQPSTVTEDAVDALRGAEALAATQPPESRYWAPGDLVAVSVGAACGLRGMLVRVEKDRATVALMMLGVLRQVDIALCNLVPAAEGQSLDD